MKNDKVLKEWDYSCKKEGDLLNQLIPIKKN